MNNFPRPVIVLPGPSKAARASMSESTMSDADIENALRDAVDRRFQSNPEHLTVKRIRTDVEHQLGLGDGFFKADVTWNARSKEIIQLQVVR